MLAQTSAPLVVTASEVLVHLTSAESIREAGNWDTMGDIIA